MERGRTVMVIGTGTIGEPLIGLLADLSGALDLDEVIFHKHTPLLSSLAAALWLLDPSDLRLGAVSAYMMAEV